MSTPTHDVAIIGGGIVGLATAYNLTQRDPDLKVTILEKEAQLAHHQTGHNSGVLHSGIYYKPGSLKAINCRAGKAAMQAFCDEHDIPYKLCGKVIVATHERELPKMQDIYERGQANGVSCELISAERCKEIEPHAASIGAIHVPEAGIVDYKQVCEKMAELMRDAGHGVRTSAKVTAVRRVGDESVVETTGGEVNAKLVVNCAGLQCDRVTKMTGVKPAAQIVPFRGEYFDLKPEAEHLCKTLIYPVPDPAFPFLGVHFTSMIHGGVECGPNAVLALGRECYGKFQVHFPDLFESLTYGGFLKMAAKHWKMGLGEMWRSYSKKAFVKALQRLMPEIEAKHLTPCPSGIRAQAVTADGGLVDDFLIDEAAGVVNVNNAPSPAATASLNIGKLIAEKLETRLG
ncbi:L-2-hydroxyglutarate oxidase [Algisphaera agarilytica]|uniref:L-2-hydroxyglutarate oxidase n=1 Tax=Algisphaera agarilytica TaxID=1385975 RepID=A0A7X0LLN3_9BACT|nr:L-2-hydroxyglutarate oxidase [Algisphaera agarilytica]MBB6430816.1 L-2-hydroxyglutarate oxidase [Algisphaera agarilytica]